MLVDTYDIGPHLWETDHTLPQYTCLVWVLACSYFIPAINHSQSKDKQLTQVAQNSSQGFLKLKLRIKILSLSGGASSMRWDWQLLKAMIPALGSSWPIVRDYEANI